MCSDDSGGSSDSGSSSSSDSSSSSSDYSSSSSDYSSSSIDPSWSSSDSSSSPGDPPGGSNDASHHDHHSSHSHHHHRDSFDATEAAPLTPGDFAHHPPHHHAPYSHATNHHASTSSHSAFFSRGDSSHPHSQQTSSHSDPAPHGRFAAGMGGLIAIILGVVFTGTSCSNMSRSSAFGSSMGPPAVVTFGFGAIGVLVSISGLVAFVRALNNAGQPAGEPESHDPGHPPDALRKRFAACPGCGARPNAHEATCRYCGGSLLHP